jgi:hypothetical protein
MAYCCPASVQAYAIRVTRLNNSGVPVDPVEPEARIQSSAFVELSLTPLYESPNRVVTRDQCGNVMLIDNDFDVLVGFDLSLRLCGVPAPLLEMMVQATISTDATVALKDSRRDACQSPLMVELWSKNASYACPPGGVPSEGPWIHWVLPRTTRWEIDGSLAFANSALEVSLRGHAVANPGWFPSLPGPDFASYVDGWPVGEPPCVLPAGADPDPWTLTDLATIRDAGPLAWKCVGSLPAPLDECGYVPVSV